MPQAHRKWIRILRQYGPVLSVLGLAIFALSLGTMELFSGIVPSAAIAGVFFWSVFYPVSLPYSAIFLLGLLEDVQLGFPLGISSLLLMLLRALIIWRRRFFTQHLFWAIWGGFVLLSGAVELGRGTLFSWLRNTPIPWQGVGVQWGAGVLAYPFFHLVFARVYAALPAHLLRENR